MAEQIVKAPIRARVIRFHVQKGASVKLNERVCDIEAMKMEVAVFSPAAGTIKDLLATPSQSVEAGTPLFSIEV